MNINVVIFFKNFLLFILILLFCQNIGFAIDFEHTVSYLKLNESLFFDIDIILNKDQEILLPIKQIADILEREVKIDHADKTVKIGNYEISKNNVCLNGAKISDNKNIYIKNTILDSKKDDIFVSAKLIGKIFDSNVATNKSELACFLNTNLHLSYFKNNINNENEGSNKEIKAYTQIISPLEKKRFTFDTFEINNMMTNDSVKTIYQNSTSNTTLFNNNTQMSLKGQVFDGKYSLDFNTNNYQDKIFSFGGLSFTFLKEFENMNLLLGKIQGFDGKDSIATQVMGVQIFDYDKKDLNYRNIEGKVRENSLVKVYFDDVFHSTISTYRGYFTLKDIYLDYFPKRVTLEEVLENGEKEVIYSRNFNFNKDYLSKNETQKSLLAGVSGFNDRLFSQDGYIYQMNTKKLVLGAQRKYGFSDNTTLDTQIIYDKILSNDKSSIWAQNYYNNNSILSMGTYRNPNTLHGCAVIQSIKHKKSDNLEFALNGIVSMSEDITINNYEEKKVYGRSISFDTKYKKENYNIELSLYNQSPDFYLPGNQTGFVSDRLGAKISGGVKFKNTNINGSYNKYISNIDKRLDCSQTHFDEVSISLNTKIPKVANLRFNSNLRRGSNNIGENLNYFYDINLQRNLKNNIMLELGKQESSFETIYKNENNQNFNTLYSTIYSKISCNLPNNKGLLVLGHDILNINSNDRNNDYNLVSVSYTFPEYKRILLSTNVGYRYTGLDRGLNYGASIGYRLQSGTIISLNYQYNTNAGYLFDNMYIPSNTRHSINLTFNDVYAFSNNGIKPIGYLNENNGFLEIVAYLDKNKNNSFDRDVDICVKNVPFKISSFNDTYYTDKNGFCKLKSLEKGVYSVQLETEKLPSTLSSSKSKQESEIIFVSAQKTTLVEFPLKSTVGNIKGNLSIIDDFGRNLKIDDFIVVLYDHLGNEIEYSTVDSNGQYCFSGIEPGNYIIKMDDKLKEINNLMDYNNSSSINVEIPYEYENFVDINVKDLIYKSW